MDRLKRLLLRHWWLKLLSLALAYALWHIVTQSPPVERRVSAPLELRGVPPELRVVGELPGRVHLHLHGPEARLRTLEPGEVAVILNLRRATPGNHAFRLAPSDVEVPPGIRVVRIIPQEIRLEFAPAGENRSTQAKENP